jgi:hypothetical protein
VAADLFLHLLDTAIMKSFATSRAILTCGGLIVGPCIWAINTQLGEILSYAECGSHRPWLAVNSFGAAAVAILAGLVSWRSAHNGIPKTTARFLGSVSGLAALLFAFALTMQGAASLVLSGCER